MSIEDDEDASSSSHGIADHSQSQSLINFSEQCYKKMCYGEKCETSVSFFLAFKVGLIL